MNGFTKKICHIKVQHIYTYKLTYTSLHTDSHTSRLFFCFFCSSFIPTVRIRSYKKKETGSQRCSHFTFKTYVVKVTRDTLPSLRQRRRVVSEYKFPETKRTSVEFRRSFSPPSEYYICTEGPRMR